MDQKEPDQNQPLNEQEARIAQADKLFQTGHMLIYGKRKSVDRAIKCIQKAITLIDSDYRYWNLLGEAYFQRGSLNPSINCFIKSLAYAEKLAFQDDEEKERILNDCTHSKLRMSDIRLSVSHLEEAATGYQEIITENPDYVAALVGLSKVELQRARNCFYSGLVKSGHTHCMNALEYSLRAIKLDPNVCSNWKLASDCCLTQFIYGQRGPFTTKIDVQFPGSEQDGFRITRYNCIDLAQQFLCKAIAMEQLNRNSGYLWHNLGITLYLKSTILTSAEERQTLLKRSLKCLFKALKLDPSNSQMRNSIGVVAFNLNFLNTAQSFLIKSIQTNLSTSEIQFSNLGYIYLQKGELRLASVAFSRCQAEEPLYCRSWLGNALINENNNLDNLSFLRHCHKLENNYEAQIMYATKVASLPITEEYSKDLINALDCMERLVNYNQVSLEVNNTLGLIYERSGFYNQARTYFDIAYRLAPQDSRVIFNKLRLHSTSKNSCCSQDQAMKADVDFINSAERLANGGNLEYMLNFICYLFKNRDFKGINQLITKLLEKLTDSKSKISAQLMLVLVAKAENGDFESLINKNFILSGGYASLESLLSLSSLMLIVPATTGQEQPECFTRSLKRTLIRYLSITNTKQFTTLLYSFEGTWIRLILLISIFCLEDRGKFIRTLVALYPNIADLWLYLGLSLMYEKTSHQMAIYCIEKANLIGSTQSDLCVICNILLAILVRSETATNNNLEARINHLSRAIFRKPNHELLWKSLKNSMNLRTKNLSRKVELLDLDDLCMYQLALDLTIKMSSS